MPDSVRWDHIPTLGTKRYKKEDGTAS